MDSLHTLCNLAGGKISYANVSVFHNMVRGRTLSSLSSTTFPNGNKCNDSQSSSIMLHMDMVELIIRDAANRSSDGEIIRFSCPNEAASSICFFLFTPTEDNIIYGL